MITARDLARAAAAYGVPVDRFLAVEVPVTCAVCGRTVVDDEGRAVTTRDRAARVGMCRPGGCPTVR